MLDQVVAEAARNNAAWHQAVCGAHGVPGEFRPDAWINMHQVPPFYSNGVTLTADAEDAQLALAREVLEARSGDQVGFKDSFARLDLSKLGFRVLFKADWIARKPGSAESARPRETRSAARFQVVRDASGLRDWERAWGETPAAGMVPIFRTPLLGDRDVAFLAAYEGGAITAGLIANRTGRFVGISNLFLPAVGAARLRFELVENAARLFPDQVMVGYEHGEDLEAMLGLGFEKIGPLTVWIRDSPGRSTG